MKQATNVVFLFFVLFAELSTCSGIYYWRQGFSEPNCQGAMIYTEVYPLSCVKDPVSLYQRANCDDTQVIVFDCEDPACSDCPNNDTFAFSACNNVDGQIFQSESYVCTNTEPTANFTSAQIEIGRSAAKGGCTGDFDYETFTSLDGPCKSGGGNYFALVCNDNKTVTRSNCGSDLTCQACAAGELVEFCETGTNGFFTETTCYKPETPSTSTTTTTSSVTGRSTLVAWWTVAMTMSALILCGF